MIDVTKKKRKKLYKLLRMWTRAEIMARYSKHPEWRDFSRMQIKCQDKIRKLLYGDSDMYALGVEWNMLKKMKKMKKKKK